MADFSRFKRLTPWLSLSAQWWQHRLVVPGLLALTLALGALAWQFNLRLDHTHNHRNSLSPASLQVLKAMPGNIEVTAFCSNSPYKGRYFRKSIQALLQRYQTGHAAIDLQFIDPASAPAMARTLQIKNEGEMIIRYRGQTQHMYLPYTEEAFTNVLLQLQHGQRAPLLFTSGQGEARLEDTSPTGASLLAQALQEAGLQASSGKAFASGADPQHLPTLVLAGASRPYTAPQVAAIESHIAKGGNLVWLTDNPTAQGLQAIATQLRLEISLGTVIDPANRQFDLPLHALSTQRYAGHGPTRDFSLRTFFDEAHAIIRYRQPEDPWQTLPLVAAAERGWTSRAYRSSHRQVLPPFNADTDHPGPVTVALALERKRSSEEMQRILVIGSQHFFSNAQLQRGGNLALAMQSLKWVVNNQPTITLPANPLRDSVIALPAKQTWLMLLFNGFQFGLPLALLLAGGWRWRRKLQQ